MMQTISFNWLGAGSIQKHQKDAQLYHLIFPLSDYQNNSNCQQPFSFLVAGLMQPCVPPAKQKACPSVFLPYFRYQHEDILPHSIETWVLYQKADLWWVLEEVWKQNWNALETSALTNSTYLSTYLMSLKDKKVATLEECASGFKCEKEFISKSWAVCGFGIDVYWMKTARGRFPLIKLQ